MTAPLRFLCLAGDGIGPEIMSATLDVLDALRPALSRPVEIIERDIGFASLKANGTTITDAVIDTARVVDGVILGPVSHNDYPPLKEGGLNPSGVLRKSLQLHANIRPARVWPGCTPAIRGEIDLIVARENLEGFYADRNMHEGSGEFMPTPGVGLAMRRITTEASLNIARSAFDWAERRPARKVAAIHKANVMRLTDGIFLDAVRSVAARHPAIAYEEMLVDAAAAHLVREPERFDVIVTTNMFGDILSDLASELTGSLGLAGSLNAGLTHCAAQAQHGSAPDLAGQDKANPASLIVSLAMMLDHLGEGDAARRIEAGLGVMLQHPETRTADLGGTLGCRDFARQLSDHLGKGE